MIDTIDLRGQHVRDQTVLWAQVFGEFDSSGVSYVVLRDADCLAPMNGRIEIDLLIAPDALKSASAIMRSHGFVKLRRWGHAPHHFFIAYDREHDVWVKLDVVTELVFGHPSPTFKTSLGEICLKNRIRATDLFKPTPEAEISALLMHCLLDKEAVTPHRLEDLRRLSSIVEDRTVEENLRVASAGSLVWSNVRLLIRAGDAKGLAALAHRTQRALARSFRVSAVARNLRSRLLRKVSKIACAIRPETPSIALLAPDGAGKSTLARELTHRFCIPGETVYMGMYQRESASIFNKIPGVAFSTRLVRQWARYLKGRYRRGMGRLIIFDRYSYDALLPSKRAAKVSQRLRRWCLAHSCPNVDLVLLLDAPGEVLFARKQEHSSEALEQQRQAYRSLSSRVPQMVIVDANRDAEEVRRDVTACIWRNCWQRQEVSL